MKEILKKIKENKILKVIGNILYFLLFVLVILLLLVVIMQRASDNSISVAGVRMFTVATGSMEPVYEVGDVLISKEISPEDIKIDDDVVYRGEKGSFDGKIVTHRVIDIQKDGEDYRITTKGVANTEKDPEITQDQVYGKVVYKVRTLSLIAKLISNIYIFYFIIFIPIAIIIYRQIKNLTIKDEEEEEIEEKQEREKTKKGEEKNKIKE